MNNYNLPLLFGDDPGAAGQPAPANSLSNTPAAAPPPLAGAASNTPATAPPSPPPNRPVGYRRPQSERNQPPPLSPELQRESRIRMRNCKSQMLDNYPFFGRLALKMPLQPDDQRTSIAADGQNIYYNPRWVSEHNADQLKYAIARVVMACALKHHTRRGDRDYARWQAASRIVTSHFLKDSGINPGAPGDDNSVESGAGMNESIEKVYDLLKNLMPDQDNPEQQPQSGQGSGQSQGQGQGRGQQGQQNSGSGQGSRQSPGQSPGRSNNPGQQPGGQGQQPGQSNSGSGSSQSQDPNQQPGSNPGQGGQSRRDQSRQDQNNQSGQGSDQADNNQNQPADQPPGSNESPKPGEPSPPNSDPKGQGEVMDSPAGSDPEDQDAQRRSEEQEWDQALHSALQFAKSVGNQPGNMAEFVAAMHQSQVAWTELLRRFMYAHSKSDYTWARPNTRYIHQGLYMPTLDNPTMPSVVLSIDTSGSMSNPELAQVWSEIKQLTAELEPESVHVIQCDTQVNSAEEYNPGNLPEDLEAKGRGGTAFTPAFEYIDDNLTQKPACMIYCTDLYGYDFPDPPPDYPVLWMVTGRNKPPADPPFGERIDLDFPG